ncbi:hypothetical protein [Allonocardiopsis opalescens]|uniref:hypothetical protein n=1 Tax=Allonocardiopsis opalescens TaxID=1144618 RepID=UPI001B80088F
MTGSSSANLGRAAGCAEGESGRSGVRVLFFGTQESGNRLRQPGTWASTTTPRVADTVASGYAQQWAAGFAECRGSNTAILALGVNNKSDGGVGGAAAGARWAALVSSADSAISAAGVTVTAAVDAEPGWSNPAWARGWLDAFTDANSRTLYAVNSADGCPTYGSTSTTCNNGWTVADVHYVSTGAASTVRAIPQIYRTDGIQARQWSRISSWGARGSAGPVRFAGAFSQRTACQQRGCTNTDNTPAAAWTQLYNELNAHSETAVDSLPYSTDVRWP